MPCSFSVLVSQQDDVIDPHKVLEVSKDADWGTRQRAFRAKMAAAAKLPGSDGRRTKAKVSL